MIGQLLRIGTPPQLRRVPAAPVITTASLDGGTDGVAYSATLAKTGTAGGTWSISAGALPSGLSLNASTGEISGTPDTVETANFTAKYTDPYGQSDTQALSIEIVSAFGLRWSDDFERADSATLGGDWTEDPTYNNFAISGGNLARPGGSFNYAHAWVTSGAAVASAKDRIAIEAKGYGSAGSNYNLGFGMGAAAGQLASVHGYGVWRATGSGVSILRLEADGSPTVLASRSPSGLSSDGSTTTDLKLEIIKDGAAVILRLYENGVQLGADINDATPGDAYGVFTTAYPTVNSNGSAANAPNNPRVGGVEVSY